VKKGARPRKFFVVAKERNFCGVWGLILPEAEALLKIMNYISDDL